MPRHRLEERLLLRNTTTMPPSPLAKAGQVVPQAVVDAFDRLFTSKGHVILATDGRTDSGTAAWGITLAAPGGGPRGPTFGDHLIGEDQTSWAAEVAAISIALRAASRTTLDLHNVRLTWVYDNTGVAHQLVAPRPAR